MTDEFYDRFGELYLGPKDTARPGDGVALYERGSNVRRYTFEGVGAVGWAVDARTGERAFRAERGGRVILPDGRAIGTPRPLPPPKAKATTAQQIYRPQITSTKARRPADSRLARSLYGKPASARGRKG